MAAQPAGGIGATAELWCHAPPAVVGERYRARLATRSPGHPGEAYVPELIALAERAAPLRRGPFLEIDTTVPLDVAGVIDWVAAVFD